MACLMAALSWLRRAVLLGAAVFFALQPRSALALANVTLAWNPSTSPNVAYYNIYYGADSGTYGNVISVTATNVVVSNLIEGTTYFFAASTVDTSGVESQLSSQISYLVPTSSTSADAPSPVNQPPTLSPLSNLAINENAGLQTVNLSNITSGSNSQPATLIVTAGSSNPALISSPTINYTSPNQTGTISFAPNTNTYGTATITVTVNNQGASNNLTSQSFVVTVNPVNQPPTLDPLNNVGVIAGMGYHSVNLTGISSGLTNQNQPVTLTASSSNPQLIAPPSINYTFPNSSGTLTFRTSGSTIGTSTISITVNNGSPTNNSITRSFIVSVLPKGSTAPNITKSPTNGVALAGQSVTFNVTATGTTPLNYQWQFNSVNLPSATNATLTLNNISTGQTGQYRVIVSNALGQTNTAASLSVAPTAAATLTSATPQARGQFALTINGVAGYKYAVQVSTNLVDWVSVATNTAPFTFVDSNASHFSQRFYRSLYLP